MLLTKVVVSLFGWRISVGWVLERALRPYADDVLPPMELFISRDLLPKGSSDRLIVREVQAEMDERIRGFVLLRCPRHQHQAPVTRVTVLDTMQGVVDLHVDELAVESRDSASQARLISLRDPEVVIPVENDVLQIGGPHAPGGVVALPDATVSGRHVEILARCGRFEARDLGSLNGTVVNGEPIGAMAHDLEDGDTIQVGSTVLTFASGVRSVRRAAHLIQGA